MCAVAEDGEMKPRIKVSDTVEKITNPGLKEVYRIYNEEGKAVCDMLAIKGEEVDVKNRFRFIDPSRPWKEKYFENFIAKPLQRCFVKDGNRIVGAKPLAEIRAYVAYQLENEIWHEEQRFENPHPHYLDMTPKYYEMKMEMLHEKN